MKEWHLNNPKRYWLGKKRKHILSKETLEKVRIRMLGNKYTKGMRFPNRKRTQKHSQETREKIGIAFRGNKHPLWKGGGMNYWKKEVLKRDNYTCQRCGISDPDVLEVDHIIPKSIRRDLLKELSNLVTLCANCHMKKTKNEKRNKIIK